MAQASDPLATRQRLAAVVCFGLLCVSSGAVLVRFSSEAPSLAIAFYRMFWASVLLLPFYIAEFRRGKPPISRFHFLAGLALACHFAFWIASLRYTSVAVSVLLVNTSPVLVSVAGRIFLGERLENLGKTGISLSFLGGLLLVLHDLDQLGDLRGPVLAILGAVALGTYLVLGRHLRSGLSVIAYAYPTYAVAALVLGALSLLTGTEISGFPTRVFLSLFLLGLIPQTLGHTSYNWALGYLPATTVSVLILAEPLVATAYAWFLLNEPVPMSILPGAILVATGILMVVRSGARHSQVAPSTAREKQ